MRDNNVWISDRKSAPPARSFFTGRMPFVHATNSVKAQKETQCSDYNQRTITHRPCALFIYHWSLGTNGIAPLKLGTHYLCPRAVFTGRVQAVTTAREHGCPKWRPWVSKNNTRVHGPCWNTMVTNTAREHGCHFLTLVFTGRGHG